MHINLRTNFISDPWFLIGASFTTLFCLIALIGPILSPHDPWEMSFDPISPPTIEHILGTNDCGQDIFSELLYSIHNTIFFGLSSGFTTLIFGVAIGLTSGWYGGKIDLFLMRLADILLATPSIMILILAASFFHPSPITLALLLALLMWPTISKVVRANTLILRESLHIKAAKQMGASNWYIIKRHLLPEMYPIYLIGFTSKIRSAVFMEASLAFLGLFDPTRKSLGIMISYSLKYYYLGIWWNWLMPPIICLSVLITATTFLAISLEKVMDPRLKESLGDNLA
ncbi:MAG: ABC transporter permease [Desulfobulbaceae bacterium]|nr:ABC transporter permease [Desulfobulbaceae bacterium]